MTVLLTAAQMRHLETQSIETGAVTGLELMERAGHGVVEAICEEWPDLKTTAHRAVVLCGPGNNGGDGFVVARMLKKLGWDLVVFFYGAPEKLPVDARMNYDRWAAENPIYPLGFPILNATDADRLRDAAFADSGTDLIIDALFGIGLSRPLTSLRPIFDLCVRKSSSSKVKPARLVAIDVPSGLHSDTGTLLSAEPEGGLARDVFQADLTVSFQSAKIGHYLGSGTAVCGRVVIKDIGIGPYVALGSTSEPNSGVTVSPHHSETDLIFLTQAPIGLGKGQHTHKFSHGHAVIASGSTARTGAARLAARGALRIGAGLVTLASPSDALQENASHLTAIMLRPADMAQDFATLLSDERISSVCLGPGFARDHVAGGLDFSHTREIVKTVLKADKKTVLDADALSAFQDAPSELFAALHPNCVLTPHEGEFRRLFPAIHTKLTKPDYNGAGYSKVDATRDAARQAGCAVLFKGADTVIAGPDGQTMINAAQYNRAAPWLATAGSGDVLAGFIAGLMARGFDPLKAAGSAAWLHVTCALTFGPGLIAEDIPEQMPAVFRALGH
nr:NAD(P)H-hydrate dehydratase [Amylibacter sp.]